MKLQVCSALFFVMTIVTIVEVSFALALVQSSTLIVTMDRINFGYSMKNIPIAKEKEIQLELIHRSEIFIRRARWRTYHYLNPNVSSQDKETFNFNTTKAAPIMPELKELEDRMYDLIKNIEFRNTNNNLQRELKRDLNRVKTENKVVVSADKTSNHYSMEASKYNDLLDKSITKDYKKADNDFVKSIITGDKEITDNLEISDRVYSTQMRSAFVTVKDHKPNYQNNTQCRLLNPAKSDIGKISKLKLARIVENVRESSGLNQWKNSDSVITWFKNIGNKQKTSFIQFDICDYYSSISPGLLEKAIKFAETFTPVSDEEKKTFYQARKTFLVSRGQVWAKKKGNCFDVAMGSNDSAEVSDLCGLYLLSLLAPLKLNPGLYRDDGLIASTLTPRQNENIKKKICKIFNDEGLKITIEANVKVVDFLDITLDINRDIFKPYMKPNNIPLYIHKEGSHPPSILKNVPHSVNDRLSRISANEQLFDEAAPPYQKALEDSGYAYKLKYSPPEIRGRKNRPRKIIYFNPPFSLNVKTNVGGRFLQIIRQCFPKGHPLHKIFNMNTVKVSYSCMPNMTRVIAGHNARLLDQSTFTIARSNCMCQEDRDVCPVGVIVWTRM